MKKTKLTSHNLILRSLSARDLSAIIPHLSLRDLERGRSLFEPQQKVDSVYFPVGSVISFLGDTGDGGSVELWSVGWEGLADIFGIFDGASAFRAVVQVSGPAYAIDRSVILHQFHRISTLYRAITHYYGGLHVQVSQLGVCNHSHSIEERFCRWLLMVSDRSTAKTLEFTHDGIAGLLGTRRATISVAAAILQNERLISYTPGSITIKSRQGLQAKTCNCYKFIRGRFGSR